MKFIRNIFKNSYLEKLYRKDKFLFGFVLFFALASLFANLIKLETTPFFVWRLYSERYYPQQEYSIYEIRFDDNELLNIKHTWDDYKQLFLTEPLRFYLYVKSQGGKDPWQSYLENYWSVKHPAFRVVVHGLYNRSEQFESFPVWYKKYLSQIEKREIKNIYILKKKIRFEKDGNVTEISSDTSLVIK